MGDFRVTGASKIVVLCAIVEVVFSTGLGRCPIYPQFPNYDISRMTGTWYEVERSFHLMEIAASCTELEVTLNERGYLLITINTINRWTGGLSTTYGLGIPSHNGSSAFRYKLNNRMPYVIGRLLPGAGQYNILFTDYENFALVWSCTNFSIAHSGQATTCTPRRNSPATTHTKAAHTPTTTISTIVSPRNRSIIRRIGSTTVEHECTTIIVVEPILLMMLRFRGETIVEIVVVGVCAAFVCVVADRMWILGRQRDIEAALRAQIYAILLELNLDPDRLILTKNHNCTVTDTELYESLATTTEIH